LDDGEDQYIVSLSGLSLSQKNKIQDFKIPKHSATKIVQLKEGESTHFLAIEEMNEREPSASRQTQRSGAASAGRFF